MQHLIFFTLFKQLVFLQNFLLMQPILPSRRNNVHNSSFFAKGSSPAAECGRE